MNSFMNFFYCCKRMNYNNEIFIDSKIPEEEGINLDEKNTKQKKSNNIYKSVNNINNINMNGINFLLDQSNPKL